MLRHTFVAFAIFAAGISVAAAETPVERAGYLVNAVMACDGCHTPRGPQGFDMSKRFSGGSQVWDEAAYTVRGSNITPDRDTGIGTWSADDLKRLMVDGKRPNGVPVAPQMPYGFYKILRPATSTRSWRTSERSSPSAAKCRRRCTRPRPMRSCPAARSRLAATCRPIGSVKRGFYLATLAHCMECHSRKPDGTPDFVNSWGKGGHEMKGPFGSVIVSNILSHNEKGVGVWSDDELRRALIEGKGRDGRAFKQPMARHVYFSKMTDQDINAIIAWMRTIPPVE